MAFLNHSNASLLVQEVFLEPPEVPTVVDHSSLALEDYHGNQNTTTINPLQQQPSNLGLGQGICEEDFHTSFPEVSGIYTP